VISAVDLIKGIGILAGLEVMEVPGITGFVDTNYDGKAQYTLEGLRKKDFVYVHVEAPDEASHMGDLRLKVEAIEAFDQKIVGTILGGMKEFKRYKVMVIPDHLTPLSVRTHTADPVPFAIYSNEGGVASGHGKSFDEVSASQSGIFIEKGFELIDRFLNPHGSC
jgi:2,3-bisphosphoglycerate-independent phosphoglycerate mutase